MKLYSRKLGSLEELKREKARLQVEKRYSKASDLMPIKELKGGDKSDGGLLSGLGDLSTIGGDGVFGTVMKVVTAKNNLQRALALAGPLMGLLARRRQSKAEHVARMHGEGGKKKAGIVKKAATELIGGYLKWKALQMSFRGVKLVINWQKTRPERKRRRR
jgi:hypothetical protein